MDLTTESDLTYCTNIYSGDDWPTHFSCLKDSFPAIKRMVSPEAPLGIGLRLSHRASLALQDREANKSFEAWLKEENAYVAIMNGFPYGDFHGVRVKDQVHAPDWNTAARVEYTMRLFDLLTAWVPSGMDGGVSTSPLTYKHWIKDEMSLKQALHATTLQVLKIVPRLFHIKESTGKWLHLDIEPEPDGLLSNGRDFIHWYKNYLLPLGIPFLAKQLHLNAAQAAEAIKRHVCLCYDVCHYALNYESFPEQLQLLEAEDIRIGRFQISAALKALLPRTERGRLELKEAFSAFDEPTYLHQVQALKDDNTQLSYPDLPDALRDIHRLDVKEWRTHFHVPIFTESFGLLQSTQAQITEVLDYHKKLKRSNHLEVETYTWHVLPDGLKVPMEQSIARELLWVKHKLT